MVISVADVPVASRPGLRVDLRPLPASRQNRPVPAPWPSSCPSPLTPLSSRAVPRRSLRPRRPDRPHECRHVVSANPRQPPHLHAREPPLIEPLPDRRRTAREHARRLRHGQESIHCSPPCSRGPPRIVGHRSPAGTCPFALAPIVYVDGPIPMPSRNREQPGDAKAARNRGDRRSRSAIGPARHHPAQRCNLQHCRCETRHRLRGRLGREGGSSDPPIRGPVERDGPTIDRIGGNVTVIARPSCAARGARERPGRGARVSPARALPPLEARGSGPEVSLSLCVAQCLGEYFTLREEMATALETPTQPGELSRRSLLAETEQRLVATFEQYVDDLVALLGGVDALLAIADRAAFPPSARPRTSPRWPGPGAGQRPHRFVDWRQAVIRMLQASGRPVPWPLAIPRQAPTEDPRSRRTSGTILERP